MVEDYVCPCGHYVVPWHDNNKSTIKIYRCEVCDEDFEESELDIEDRDVYYCDKCNDEYYVTNTEWKKHLEDKHGKNPI